jgi:hypothetical protein
VQFFETFVCRLLVNPYYASFPLDLVRLFVRSNFRIRGVPRRKVHKIWSESNKSSASYTSRSFVNLVRWPETWRQLSLIISEKCEGIQTFFKVRALSLLHPTRWGENYLSLYSLYDRYHHRRIPCVRLWNDSQ